MKAKSVDTYVRELKSALVKKFGEYDVTLEDQVVTAAMNRWMMVRMHEELKDSNLTVIAVGSMGQQKTEVNPLLAAYDKAQRTYIQQLAALGLNKLSEKKADAQAKKETADTNPFMGLQEAMKGN